MVASHSKLGVLSLHDEIWQILLLWELIAEPYSIVIHAETQVHETTVRRLLHLHEQLVVVVADVACLAPYGLPGLIECRSRCHVDTEGIEQRVLFGQLYS